MGECLLLVHRPPPMHLSIGSPCSYGGFQHRNHRCGAGSSQNAVSCKAMANKELNPDHGHEQQQLVAGKGYLMPLKKLEHVIRFENARGQKGVEGMAWLGQKFFQRDEVTDADEKTKRQQKVQETFRKINQAEKERLQNEFERYRKARLQVEREQVQLKAWTNFHDWLLGDLKGTPHDPEPGGSIPFSQFRTLLEAGKVNYVDYADYGEHIAAVLAYYADKGNKSEQKVTIKDGLIQAPERPLVYKRHWVQQMPADAMNDVWKRLHPQLKGIRIIKTNTIPQLLYPQLKIMTVWGLRLALATAVYLFLERNLSYFYRFRNPDDRGWNEDRDLTAGDYVLGALGESRARFLSAEEKTGVTFDDFAGQDYVKRELQEVVQLLKESKEDPTLYVPKGVLLHGPPGTGKTLLARAIAGEAGLPFFSASGSEFVEMFAGVAAARVKDLFARARNFAPSIIFIDEIDAIGAKRGGPDVGGGGVEREQGLIQMLTELDGFQTGLSKSRVLVIGATNRVDMLDPALLRKGRFDKIMAVGLPSEEGRLAILRVHAKNKPFRSEEEKETLLKGITNLTNRFSGAELANVLNEAVILSTRHDKDFIEKTELHEAIERQGGSFATGQEDVLDVTGEARTRLAYREAAVAVLECYFPNTRSPFLKTNIKTMDTMVNMEYAEPPDYVYAKKNEYVESIVRICAPRIVEELIFGKDNVSWLSGSFLSEAGILVDRLIFQTGMTALGRTYYKTTKDVLPHLNAKVQALRDEYMRFAVQKCTSVLLEYRSALETMADRLMEKQELEAAEIWEIFKKSPRVPQPEVYPVDGYGPLVDIGRWGIHGVSLPGRVTFHPGNVGYATFGAPKPIQVQFIHDDTWEYFNAKVKRNMQELEKKLQTEEGRKWVSDELLQRYFFADHY